MALVTSDELAKDVASAEALLDRHQVMNDMHTHQTMKTVIIISYN